MTLFRGGECSENILIPASIVKTPMGSEGGCCRVREAASIAVNYSRYREKVFVIFGQVVVSIGYKVAGYRVDAAG